jgi:ABC-2 type transport system ATP-binding protein
VALVELAAGADELEQQLQGDTIQIELAEPDDGRARLALERVGEVGEARLEGGTLYARARDGGAAIPAVLAALDAHGVNAASVTLARPSLDDVYMRHAGRAFHTAHSEQEEVAA